MILGIDPDIDKCGCAFVEESKLTLKLMTPVELLALLHTHNVSDWTIRVEAGWLNNGNWHLKNAKTIKAAAEIGNRTGQNHAIAKLIASVASAYCKNVQLIRPNSKKLTSDQFFKLTGIEVKNKELIDAGRIVLEFIKTT
jgi:hypothetical protein